MLFYRVYTRYVYMGYVMRTKYSILEVFYKAFYEYSIRHSTGYSIVYSVKYI